uniref:carbon-nitrogen hydrolase family protein n=1 Tax=Flavobacterium sp. TaxID=239 RepID=UPI00404A5E10
MKICIAQTHSLKGEIQENIKNHLQIIENAVASNADLIIFPELSITNYEPTIAKAFATDIDDTIFNPFQEISDKNDITIGIGMPTNAANGIQISMLIFQPNQKRLVYAKQLLHEDELPYFVCGTNPISLKIKDKNVAIGICFETLQRKHFLQSIENGADIYVASVAKSKNGIAKAFSYFPAIAKEFKKPVLMSNCVGACDDFMSVGQSAVWNSNGDLVKQLDSENQGILIYDAESELVETCNYK